MASRISRSLIRTLKYRNYGSAAVAQSQSSLPADIEVNTLTNGLRTVAAPNDSGLARLGVICNAAPRTEMPGYEGIAHLMRAVASHNTKGPLSEEFIGVLDNRGASFKVIQTREHTLYSVECQREYVAELAEYLRAVVTAPSFFNMEKPMEKMAVECAKCLSDPLILGFELLHKAAYRHNLGNSLYCPTMNFKAFSPTDMAEFFANTMTLDNMLLVGDGVDPHDLNEVGQRFLPLAAHLVTSYDAEKSRMEALQGLPPGIVGYSQDMANKVIAKLPNFGSSEAPMALVQENIALQKELNQDILQDLKEGFQEHSSKKFAAKYYGGEIRHEAHTDFSAVFVASEGASVSSKEEATAGVLKHVMGGNIQIKRGSGSEKNRLARAVGEVTNGSCSVSALNVNYSDSGLFGFCIAGPHDDLSKGVKSAFKEFGSVTKSGGIHPEDIERAKNAYKAELAMESENSAARFQKFAEQAITGTSFKSLEDSLKEIDSVSAADVITVAKKFVNGKPSMSAVGKVSSVPYLDQLYS